MKLLFKLMARAGIAAGGIPAPAMNIDLTSTLDSRITFTRAGSRNYINAGVLTALGTSNTPAFESWDGVNRGMAIEPGFTNLLTYSGDQTNAAWEKSNITTGTGATGPDGSAVMLRVTNTTANSYHRLAQVISTRNLGERGTLSFFVKPVSGARNWSVCVRMSDQYNNSGFNVYHCIDGKIGSTAYYDSARISDGVHSLQKLSNGIYRVSITGTWVTSSWKVFDISAGDLDEQTNNSYLGTLTDQYDVWGAQYAVANGPTGYVATGAATASQAAESAIFNDTAWLTTTQGTFVIEHDCWSGPLVGSGANTVLGATVPGKTAIAWDGSTSDVVNNGGATTAGGLPTFSGSDIRLLATTGTTNAGHIKSVRFYNTRLSVADLQTLTAKTVTSTATPDVLRGVSIDNILPSGPLTTAGALLNMAVRVRANLGGHDVSQIVFDFPNFRFPGIPSPNSFIIDECALERVTGVSEFVPIRFGGGRSVTVAAGAIDSVKSDVILPSAFTGLSVFPANMEFFVRIKARVTTAGDIFTVGVSGNGCQYAGVYNPAATTISPVDATGNMSVTAGTNTSFLTYAYSPIMLGKFVSGDPKTIMIIGDSIIQGTGGSGLANGTYIKQSARNLGVPCLQYALGGAEQEDLTQSTTWRVYMKYARVLIDELGTNNGNRWIHFFDYWTDAKLIHGMDKIIKTGLLPRAANSGDFSSEGVQTGAQPFRPLNFEYGTFTDFAKYGYADQFVELLSVRGVDQTKWLTNGTPYYMTTDGTHPTDAALALLTAEFQPVLAAITVT
jgi:hypothetical protein